jgi:hypothetical protein
LTHIMLRISYRMQAFFWDSGDGRTDGIVRLLRSGERVRIPEKVVSNRKQTAVGSSIAKSGQSLSRIYATARIEPGEFPETNFFRQPIESRLACARNGRGDSRTRLARQG